MNSLVAIILLIGALFFKVIAEFLVPMFLAVLLVVMFAPLHEWFLVKCKGRNKLAAGLTTLRIELLFAADQATQRRMVEIAMPAFSDAGVGLAPRPMEWSALLARLTSKDFDAMLLYFTLAPAGDPFDRFHSSQADGGGNHSGYANPHVDRILAAARRELDPQRRAGLYREFDAIFQREQPVTVLVHPLSSVLLSRRFRGVQPGFLGLHPESWYVVEK